MDDTISAPPAFAVSRKRKRLHLIEDNSPEHQSAQLPPTTTPPIQSQSSASASTSARRHHPHLDHHNSSSPPDDNQVEDSSTTRSTNTQHHRRHRSSSSNHNNMMPRAGSDGPQGGPSSGSAAPELPSGGLNRGFACMGCRKRKSKCDTNRPSCDQCLKAKMQCVYDDRPQKRPTEVLKDRIRDLEEKVRLLEQQNPALAAVLAKQQQQQSGPSGPSSSGASGSGSHAVSSVSAHAAGGYSQQQPWSTSPPTTAGGPSYAYPPGATGGFLSPEQQRLPHSDIRSTSHPQIDPFYGTTAAQNISGGSQFMLGRQGGPSMFAIAPDTSNDPLPPGLDQMELINSFMAHRHQAYCDLSYNRFMASLAVPHTSSSPSSSSGNSHPNSPNQTNPSGLQRPHASLLNAAYLLGAFFSSLPRLAQYEPLFLHRARQGIAAALENAERLENAVQAASLVALYLYAKGRVLEGYYLACANARFAMGCGMHKVASPVWGIGGVTNPLNAGVGGAAGTGLDDDESGVNTMPLLEEPKDPIELGERIRIWWQVWMVDQCGAISTNLPPALSDTADPLARIDTCFPPEMKEFEVGGSLSFVRRQSPHSPSMSPTGGEWETLRSVYNAHSISSPMGGRSATVAKAIELFSRAWKLSKHDVKDEYFRTSFEATDEAVRRFSATLPRNMNHSSLFLPHSFALAAIIQLHWIIAVEHNNLHPSYQNCLNAATDMVSIIDIIQPADYPHLELHIGMCWKLTTDVLFREWERTQALGDEDAAIYYQALQKVQDATRQLSRVFPVLTELWKISNS